MLAEVQRAEVMRGSVEATPTMFCLGGAVAGHHRRSPVSVVLRPSVRLLWASPTCLGSGVARSCSAHGTAFPSLQPDTGRDGRCDGRGAGSSASWFEAPSRACGSIASSLPVLNRRLLHQSQALLAVLPPRLPKASDWPQSQPLPPTPPPGQLRCRADPRRRPHPAPLDDAGHQARHGPRHPRGWPERAHPLHDITNHSS